mgnify:CR=1 FL=1
MNGAARIEYNEQRIIARIASQNETNAWIDALDEPGDPRRNPWYRNAAVIAGVQNRLADVLARRLGL